MSFDRTDAADLAALKSEVLTDPQAIGYDLTAGTVQILELINEDTGRSATRGIDAVKIVEVAAVIDPGEYDLLEAYNQEWVKMFITRPVDDDLMLYKDKFLAIFPGGSVTRAAAQALLSVTGSRAEELFGAGTVLNRQDLIAARDSA